MSTAEQQPTGGGVGRLSLVTTTAIMVAAVTAFFFLFVALFFLYLRAKRYWGAIPVSGPARTQPASSVSPRRRGLDAAAVEALPSVVLCAGDPNEGVECAVCPSELGEGDAARLLPRCGHAFHLECIDKWFCSHSTCPLCRAAAEVEEVKIACSGARLVLGNAPSMDSSSDFAERFQSCVLGDCASDRNLGSTEGSSNTSESSSDLTASMSTNRLSEAEMRPPTSQTLRSLRKLLIVGSRMAGASCSTQGFDIERGCPPAAKTPSTS